MGGEPRIREAILEDAQALAELSTQLGYPAQPADVRRRLEALRTPEHAILVAEAGGVVVGFVDVHVQLSVMVGSFGEIGGLSVLDGFRRRGAGAALMAAAAAWTRERGLPRLVIRVNRARAGSHDFYLAIGCVAVKDQRIYEYPL